MSGRAPSPRTGCSWVQTSHGILGHPEPRRGLSIPAVTTWESVPWQLIKVPARDGGGRGSASQGPAERSSPRGEKGEVSSPMPPICLAQCKV